jgi:hypothetical protein
MTNNPVDMQIIGVPGRAEILRETIKNLKLPSEDIVPDRDEMERRQMVMEKMRMMEQQLQGMGMGGGSGMPQGPTAPGISPDVEGSTLPSLGSNLPTTAPGPRDAGNV